MFKNAIMGAVCFRQIGSVVYKSQNTIFRWTSYKNIMFKIGKSVAQ